MRTITGVSVALAAAMVLAGCSGGDSGGGEDVSEEVPVMCLKQWLWNALVNGFAASSATPSAVRVRILRSLGARVGEGVVLRRRVDFYGPALTLGDRVFINVGTQIQNYAPVTIGADVQIGPRVTILTVDHEIGGPTRRAVGLVDKSVTIGAGSWIAAGATILPGVTVGGCAILRSDDGEGVIEPETPTAAELEEMFYYRGEWLVMPVLCEDRELDEARRAVRDVLDGPRLFFTLDNREVGVERLRRMARQDARCAHFDAVADQLAVSPSSTRLMLGWSQR